MSGKSRMENVRPVAGTRKGHTAMLARYGTTRSFTLRTLYTWLTLTMLFTFTWPLLVLLTAAPGVAPANTPTDWYQLRLLAPALTAIFAAWLWRLSPVADDMAERSTALRLFHTGRIWPQVLVFLLGISGVLITLMLIEEPGGGLKLTLLALAEALIIQILLSGYMAAMFELLLPHGRPQVLTVILYALTFAIRGTLAAAAEETLPESELILAIASGLFVGLLIGIVSLWLRARSRSLLPGILALWLVFLLLGLGDVFE